MGQLLHIAYFGTSFAPYEIRLLFTELAEISESIGGVPGLMILPVLIVLASYAALILLSRASAPYRMHFSPAAPPLVLLLILPVRAYTSDESQRFYPNPGTYTPENALQAFSFFLVRDLPEHMFHHHETDWQPYVLEKPASQ